MYALELFAVLRCVSRTAVERAIAIDRGGNLLYRERVVRRNGRAEVYSRRRWAVVYGRGTVVEVGHRSERTDVMRGFRLVKWGMHWLTGGVVGRVFQCGVAIGSLMGIEW